MSDSVLLWLLGVRFFVFLVPHSVRFWLLWLPDVRYSIVFLASQCQTLHCYGSLVSDSAVALLPTLRLCDVLAPLWSYSVFPLLPV